jgi:hypothetical protein
VDLFEGLAKQFAFSREVFMTDLKESVFLMGRDRK